MSRKHLFEKDFEPTIKGMIRVNFAGEMGAIKIYKNQIDVFKKDEKLQHMMDSEIVHFEYFREISRKLAVPQTIFLPLWKKLAGLMGKLSAKNSYEDAMLCTQGVETVIEKHYEEQIKRLTDILENYTQNDDFIAENKELIIELLEKIKIFMQEEIMI